MAYEKMAFRVPKWLYYLPKGKYTLEEIQTLTKANKHNIYTRFEVLGVEREYKCIDGHWRNLYNWKGSEFYIKKLYEDTLKRLEE